MIDVNPLLDALRRQQEKYRELAAAAVDQKKAIVDGDADALMTVMGRKRAIMGVIEELEQRLAPARGRWDEVRCSLDEPAAREVEAAVEETTRILKELLRAEDEARAEFEGQRVKVAAKLQEIVSRQRARGAYGVE